MPRTCRDSINSRNPAPPRGLPPHWIGATQHGNIKEGVEGLRDGGGQLVQDFCHRPTGNTICSVEVGVQRSVLFGLEAAIVRVSLHRKFSHRIMPQAGWKKLSANQQHSTNHHDSQRQSLPRSIPSARSNSENHLTVNGQPEEPIRDALDRCQIIAAKVGNKWSHALPMDQTVKG